MIFFLSIFKGLFGRNTSPQATKESLPPHFFVPEKNIKEKVGKEIWKKFLKEYKVFHLLSGMFAFSKGWHSAPIYVFYKEDIRIIITDGPSTKQLEIRRVYKDNTTDTLLEETNLGKISLKKVFEDILSKPEYQF